MDICNKVSSPDVKYEQLRLTKLKYVYNCIQSIMLLTEIFLLTVLAISFNTIVVFLTSQLISFWKHSLFVWKCVHMPHWERHGDLQRGHCMKYPGMKYPGLQCDIPLCPACVRNGADPRHRAICLWKTSTWSLSEGWTVTNTLRPLDLLQHRIIRVCISLTARCWKWNMWIKGKSELLINVQFHGEILGF